MLQRQVNPRSSVMLLCHKCIVNTPLLGAVFLMFVYVDESIINDL